MNIRPFKSKAVDKSNITETYTPSKSSQRFFSNNFVIEPYKPINCEQVPLFDSPEKHETSSHETLSIN